MTILNKRMKFPINIAYLRNCQFINYNLIYNELENN